MKLTGKAYEAVCNEFKTTTLWKHVSSERLSNGCTIETVAYRGQEWCFAFNTEGEYRGNYNASVAPVACRSYIERCLHLEPKPIRICK
jgi:hypothetical protein